MILLLDSVRSKENVGALFRTADAAGVEEVVLAGITPCPINRFGNTDGKIAKSALGAEQCVLWRYEHSSGSAVEKLRKDGYRILVLEQAVGSVDYTAVNCGKNEKVALVVGNEVDGVQADVIALAHAVLHIPMHGKKESLNVTTAAGIALYALRST
jgi:23S rRNA (guanosine2251-2'-O)-methyltransferase